MQSVLTVVNSTVKRDNPQPDTTTVTEAQNQTLNIAYFDF